MKRARERESEREREREGAAVTMRMASALCLQPHGPYRQGVCFLHALTAVGARRYVRGAVYPEGPWRPRSSVQRGTCLYISLWCVHMFGACVCMHVHACLRARVYVYVCLCASMCMCLTVLLSLCPCLFLSVLLSICLSVYLSISPSLFLSLSLSLGGVVLGIRAALAAVAVCRWCRLFPCCPSRTAMRSRCCARSAARPCQRAGREACPSRTTLAQVRPGYTHHVCVCAHLCRCKGATQCVCLSVYICMCL
jgi:hypothetical protein